MKFIPPYPQAPKHGQYITPEELRTLHGRTPTRAEVQRFIEQMEQMHPHVGGCCIARRKGVYVMHPQEAADYRRETMRQRTKAQITTAGKASRIATHTLTGDARKSVESLQRTAQAIALENVQQEKKLRLLQLGAGKEDE